MKSPDRKKRLYVYDWPETPVNTYAPLAAEPYSLFLDSSRESHPLSRYSYVLGHPFETIESKDGLVTVTNRENNVSFAASSFDVVKERLSLWGENFSTRASLPPFQGGACGFFGYDLVREIEKIPVKAKRSSMPDMCIGLYDKIVAFDHQNRKACLIIHAEEEKTALVHKSWLEKKIGEKQPYSYLPLSIAWESERSEDDYKKDVQKVIDYIYAGDIFQANLTRSMTAQIPASFNPFAHYAHLREINSAPYGAYMNFGGFVLASSSPEEFLKVQNRRIETRPIKGTSPASESPDILADSEKNRAENIMIVDLLRNDLSRVCEEHSIEVETLCGIETFEGLHHMVSTVTGTVRADMDCLDVLRCCFPGGSITGAPKIRAMEIIEELEPDRRGPYCGVMGYIGFNQCMDTAITIRTLIYADGKIQLQTGGGVTARSEPEKEFQETLTKAEKILESFAAENATGKVNDSPYR
jgi:para-aminobenzoate synthetase component 1